MRVTLKEVHFSRSTYRYAGSIVVEGEGQAFRLPLPGTVGQWLTEGADYELELLNDQEEIGFDDYRLKAGRLVIWPPFRAQYTLERLSPLTGNPLYAYRVIVREARYERDYEAIVELEQYHYASDEEVLALWFCGRCGRYEAANLRPTCSNCGIPMRFHDLRSATRASRFLVMELLDRAPYEPRYAGYARVDPPVPLMHRRLPDGQIEKNIRERVFPQSWFAHPFHPEATGIEDWWSAQEEALREARSPVSRLARVVVHPDYRVDGLGQQAVRALVDWVRERRVPEMRVTKQAVEVIAMMARYNPFLERAGFVYLWDTASGRPVLYYPLSKRAQQALNRFFHEDPVAQQHGGHLYRPRFAAVEPLARSLIVRGLTKAYTNRLTLEDLSEPVRQMLEAFGVRRRVIQKLVLRDVEIELAPGTVHVILGASGSGKTTLLRALYALAGEAPEPSYLPDAGKAQVPENICVQVLLPGELEPTFGDLPISEVLYRLTGDETLAVEILNYVGISDAVLYRAPFNELSTGQKERARLAWLLAHRPNLILVDEFAAHLDTLTAMRVARRFSALAREKQITLVLTTHRHEIVETLEPDMVYMVGYGTVTAYPFDAQHPWLPDRALFVREPYASLIVEGKKTWEIRKHPTRVRGRVGILNQGQVLGTVEIVGTRGPFTPAQLAAHQDKHRSRVEDLEAYAGGRPLYAWVLKDAVRFRRPVAVPTKKGQQLWATVERDEAEENRTESS